MDLKIGHRINNVFKRIPLFGVIGHTGKAANKEAAIEMLTTVMFSTLPIWFGGLIIGTIWGTIWGQIFNLDISICSEYRLVPIRVFDGMTPLKRVHRWICICGICGTPGIPSFFNFNKSPLPLFK